MYTMSPLALVASLALATQSMALSHHRHAHAHAHAHVKARELDARGIHTHVEWVTVYETVTVYKNGNGDIKTAGKDTYFAHEKPAKVAPAPAVKSPETPKNDVAAPPSPSEKNVAAAPAPTPPSNDRAGGAPAESAAPKAPATPESQKGSAGSARPPSGGKRGFAYNDCNLVNQWGSGKGLSWAYNWDSHNNGLSVGLDYVPMLWGDRADHTNRWQKNADAMIKAGSTHMLSFNEPDHKAQANMTAGAAARAHVQYINPYAGQVRIGSPAITNSPNPGEGVEWLKDFVRECKSNGCNYDFCVAHWYSPATTSTEDFKGHLDRVHEACEGKPIWLTEFAPLGSDDQATEFLDRVLPMLDSLPYLERYSYFMMSVGSLLKAPNQPSAYGARFLAVN